MHALEAYKLSIFLLGFPWKGKSKRATLGSALGPDSPCGGVKLLCIAHSFQFYCIKCKVVIDLIRQIISLLGFLWKSKSRWATLDSALGPYSPCGGVKLLCIAHSFSHELIRDKCQEIIYYMELFHQNFFRYIIFILRFLQKGKSKQATLGSTLSPDSPCGGVKLSCITHSFQC